MLREILHVPKMLNSLKILKMFFIVKYLNTNIPHNCQTMKSLHLFFIWCKARAPTPLLIWGGKRECGKRVFSSDGALEARSWVQCPPMSAKQERVPRIGRREKASRRTNSPARPSIRLSVEPTDRCETSGYCYYSSCDALGYALSCLFLSESTSHGCCSPLGAALRALAKRCRALGVAVMQVAVLLGENPPPPPTGYWCILSCGQDFFVHKSAYNSPPRTKEFSTGFCLAPLEWTER